VQADIPDNGVIHGCYGKAGTPANSFARDWKMQAIKVGTTH
jgi:hypothetical protein